MQQKKGIAAVIAGVAIMLCLGVAYSWGVFIMPIENDMGWSRAEISMAVSVLMIVFSSFTFIGGLIEKRIGASLTASIGGLLVALAWLGSSMARSPLHLYLCYGLLGGIGTGISYIASVSCGIKWFPHKKGLVTGIILFGFGFGSAMLSPAITHLIEVFGWRKTMILGSIVFGLIVLISAQFLKSPCEKTTSDNLAKKMEENDHAFHEMIRTPVFWVMFITYFLAMIAGMVTVGHVVAFAADIGFTAMQGALALTILSIFNGLGRILSGYLSDHFGGKKILITLFMTIGLAMFIFANISSLVIFYLTVALIGLCFGGFLAVYPPLTSNFFGDKNFSVNYGLVFIGYGSGCFLGPVIGGIVYDMMNSYTMAFYSSGILSFIGAVIVMLFLKPPARKNAN